MNVIKLLEFILIVCHFSRISVALGFPLGTMTYVATGSWPRWQVYTPSYGVDLIASQEAVCYSYNTCAPVVPGRSLGFTGR